MAGGGQSWPGWCQEPVSAAAWARAGQRAGTSWLGPAYLYTPHQHSSLLSTPQWSLSRHTGHTIESCATRDRQAPVQCQYQHTGHVCQWSPGLSHNITVPTWTPEFTVIRQFTSRHLITSSEPQSSLNSLNMDNNSLSQSMDSVNTAVSVTGEEEVRKAFKYHVSDRNFSREFARIFCQVLYCSSVVKSPPQFLPSAAANIGFETDKLRKERVQSNSQLDWNIRLWNNFPSDRRAEC